MGETAVVTNLQKFSVHDGPGIRSILFLKGCPLHCQWCANPENIGPAPELMVYGAKCIGCGRCVGQCSRGAIAADGTGRPPDKGLCVDCGACAAVCPSGARVIKGARTTAEEARRAFLNIQNHELVTSKQGNVILSVLNDGVRIHTQY